MGFGRSQSVMKISWSKYPRNIEYTFGLPLINTRSNMLKTMQCSSIAIQKKATAWSKEFPQQQAHLHVHHRWESLVLGPALSPYAFGFFSFRIQFPEDYPSAAPHVVFLTTAGGKTRFNPNLYADGKVVFVTLDSIKWIENKFITFQFELKFNLGVV